MYIIYYNNTTYGVVYCYILFTLNFCGFFSSLLALPVFLLTVGKQTVCHSPETSLHYVKLNTLQTQWLHKYTWGMYGTGTMVN